jgi:hypothetical protein
MLPNKETDVGHYPWYPDDRMMGWSQSWGKKEKKKRERELPLLQIKPWFLCHPVHSLVIIMNELFQPLILP